MVSVPSFEGVFCESDVCIYIYTYISKKQQELNELRQTVLLK